MTLSPRLTAATVTAAATIALTAPTATAVHAPTAYQRATTGSTSMGSTSTGSVSTGSMVARPGQRGATVRLLQVQLEELGLFTGRPTGYYGPKTRRAVTAFQAGAHLPAIGVDTTATQKAITAAVKALIALEKPVTAHPGQRGSAVRDLQHALAYLGYFHARATGYYGRITTAAVRAFQRHMDMPVTGTVDVPTAIKIDQMVNTTYTHQHAHH